MRITRFLYKEWQKVKETWWVFDQEIRRIFRDPGVIVIFFVATIAYPILYNFIYWKDNIENVPVAVVDRSNSPESRSFLHRWNASPDITLTHYCTSMAEAERLLRDQKVHGIIYFPEDFAVHLNTGMQTAHISLYCDMSSFLYMKAIYLSCNKVMLEDMTNIQIDRYEAMGYDHQFAWQLVQAAPYTETALFCESGGYASFLIPAVLMLILHQTLFFGICMLGGTAREENKELFLLPGHRRGYSVIRITAGRSLAYFVIYMALGVFVLLAVPRMFGLPHIGNPIDIMKLLVPYLLATIFFSMSVSVFIRNRESGMVLLIATSLIFIFIAGVSWPQQMLPDEWRYLSYFFPYTWGVHGFIHINSMGATLAGTAKEYIALWILAGGYFITNCALLGISGYLHDHRKTSIA
ncbi:MAG: ABC transporter permease [Paludibacteraceae bacterium]|nr:ABC transporter permease [Paludibacteraceae bacterium]